MHRILRAVLAASVALTTIAPANAQVFNFRYRSPLTVSEVPTPPEEDVDYGIGNDIVAYFVAPLGYDFSKHIPVATQDVVEWRRDYGQIPPGIDLDTMEGVLEGKPGALGMTETLWHGYDAAGNRIARAEMHFSIFEPIGIPSEVDFYAHTNSYFYGEIPSPEGVTVHTWKPVDGVVYPDGMSMMNSAFHGTPTKPGVTDLAWRGFDYLGREVAFAWGSITVAEGPVVEELLADGSIRGTIGDQTVDKSAGMNFEVNPVVQRSLGPVTYRLLPETMQPQGITFSSATGRIGRVYDEFETSASFRIEARDSFDGTTGLSNIFTLATLPAVIDISDLKDLEGVVGKRFERKFSAPNLAADAQWRVVSGLLPDGLVLDKDTGILSGTPLKTELQTGLVIGVSGTGMIPAESNSFQFEIFPESLTAETVPLHVRVGTPFSTDGVKVTSGGSEGYTISGYTDLPVGTALDPDTGVISSTTGIATAGTYDRSLVVDAGKRKRAFAQVLRVYNPLEVSYGDIEAVRNTSTHRMPTTAADSIIGAADYTIEDTDGDPLPDWLLFNRTTGRILAAPKDPATIGTVHGPYVVTLTDDQDSQPSAPFSIKVVDRDAPEITINDRDAQRFVHNGYRIASINKASGHVTYSVTAKPSNWDASGLGINPSGWLVGRTEDPVGTVYPGLVITATDSEGYTDVSDPFDLTVIEPEGLGGLWGPPNKTITWTAGQSFSDVLPPLRNGFGKTTYTFDPPIPGVTITDPETGTFTGMIPAAGKTTHTFKIEDETDRPALTAVLTLDIRDKLDASSQGDIPLNRAAFFEPQSVPAFSGGAEPFIYSLQGTLPQGMRYLNGRLWGTPSEEGSFPLSVTVTDKTGAQTTASFALKVDAPLPFKFEYPSETLYVGESTPNGILKAPSLENAMPDNASIVWGQPQGTLPPGVGFSNGRFTGTPTVAGRYPMTVDATDGEGRPATAIVDFVVSLRGEPTFDTDTFRVRAGTSVTSTLNVTNAVAPLEFTSTDPAGMPHGLILNPVTGSITGQFDVAGSYSAQVTVEDSMDRKASTTVTFEVVGDLAVSTSDATLKQYEAAAGTPAVTAENAIGTMAYALVAGTLPANVSVDPATGAIIGTSDEFGTWPGLVIEGTDEDGTTARTEEFTLTVEQRAPLALDAPTALPLKRFSTASFAADARDAIPPVRFEVTPDLPVGLTLNEDAGTITGSSDEIVPETVYTLKAIDSKGGELGTDVASFTLKVEERDKLDISVADIQAKRYFDLAPVSVKVETGTAVGAVDYQISPALPEGLTFVDGVISGRPTVTLAATTYTVSAVDSKGGELGSDETTFSLSIADRDELGIDGPASHEFPQYFEGQVGYAPVSAIEGATFSIAPALPEGLELDAATGVISGTASEKMPATQYTLTVADAYDTFDRTITLAVGDRLALGFVTPEPQGAILGGEYSLTLEVENVVGDEVTWEHVSGDLPAGIDFDAATGTFTGSATEFGVTSNVTIRATDAFGGSADRTFVFTVIQDGTPITLTAAGGKTRMGHAFDIAAPTAENLVGDFWYTAAGLEGTGLVINRKTGQLDGKAAYAFEKDVVITLEDVTGRKADQTVKLVSAPAMTVTAQASVDLVFNYDPDPATVAAPSAANADGAVTWSHAGTLPGGLSVDPSTGGFTGKPKQIGTFGPITLVASDSLPGTASSNPVTITVTMNEDPLELSVTDFTTKVGYRVETEVPTYGNNVGSVTFFSTDLPAGYALDPATGVLSGDASALLDRIVNISMRDQETLRVISRPLHLQVIPDMQITLPQQVQLQALSQITPVSARRDYVVGAAAWEAIDETDAKLPEGITFDTATGSLVGEARELGDFGPFTVASTDSLGDRGVSNSFTIKVVPGAYFLGLEDSALPDGKRRIEDYSFDFKPLLTYIGMAENEITWTMTPVGTEMVLPEGLTLEGGVLAGTPTKAGDFVFEVKVSYGSISASRTYALKIELPEIELSLSDAAPTPAEVHTPYSFDLKTLLTVKNIDKEDVKFYPSISGPEQSYPSGITVAENGMISGTGTRSGEHKFSVRAVFTDGDEHIEHTVEYVLKVTGVMYKFREISTGNVFTCGVDMEGGVKCFGSGIIAKTNIPTTIEGLTGQSSIAAGDAHACVLSESGSIKCWGAAFSSGGMGSPEYSYVPAEVETPLPARKVATGTDNVCFIMTDNTVGCFGRGGYLVNGDGTRVDRPAPVVVQGLTDVADITVSGSHACAVTTSGAAKCWGSPNNGRTGNGVISSATADQHAPMDVVGLQSGVRQISAGSTHTCALMDSGRVKCWGAGGGGALGDGRMVASAVPVEAVGLTDAKAVAAGVGFSCAVRQNGSVQCWGDDHYQKLGNGARSDSLVPDTVEGLEINAIGVSLGQYHACAWDAAGVTQCWGLAQHGQLGPKSYTSSSSAIFVGT